MSLTPKQREIVLEAHEALKARKMVYLSGRQNGKTRAIVATQETRPVQVAPNRTMLKALSKPEDYEVQFVQAPLYGRSDKITPYTFIRQIMLAMEERPVNGYFQLSKQFEDLLWDRRREGKVICLAIDNAELLPERAYYILKMLNELRRNRQDIGIALLMAGEYGKMKMPVAFLKRTIEYEVGAVNRADLLELIDTHYPGQARTFAEEAISAIMQQEPSTLEALWYAGEMIRYRRRLDEEAVTEKTASKIIFAKAA